MKDVLSKFIMLFESKMDVRYKKIFSIISIVFTTIFFLTGDIFGNIIALTISSEHTIHNNAMILSIFEPLIYTIGMFVFCAVLGATIFIGAGEIFIRICEYFNIDSKLYKYMIKTKDTMTMNSIEFYEKYESKKLKDLNKN